MQREKGTLLCPKCGLNDKVDTFEVKRPSKKALEPVYVMDLGVSEGQTVTQTCPRCKGNEAQRIILTSQGEHAGVKQDRTVEKYTCVKCNHSWIK